MKRWTRTQVFDKLHRASVWCLLGLTGYGLTILGSYAFRYFSVVRPMQKEIKRKQKEDSIILEQFERETVLIQKQTDAEKLSS